MDHIKANQSQFKPKQTQNSKFSIRNSKFYSIEIGCETVYDITRKIGKLYNEVKILRYFRSQKHELAG